MIFEVPADSSRGLRAADPSSRSDQALVCIRRMARGDSDGLSGLYDLFSARVYSLALRILRDAQDAEEVVQDVFAQAWRSAAGYDSERASVGGWLLMMTRSRALDRLRGRRVQNQALPSAAADPDDLPAAFPGPDLVAISDEQAEQVRRGLEQLPPEQRAALELAYFEGLTHPEVAARLSQPIGTVKTRIRLGLMKLREVFARSAEQQGLRHDA